MEEKVIIKCDINIGATISYKDKSKKSPLIVLIMGTGKSNRDGNLKNFKTNFYKDLSDIFVSLGYVCIRYDKRGTYESTGNYNTCGLYDLVKDASKVVEYGKKLDYVNDKVIVCGHSEGAMIATLLTKEINIDGLILLSGACTSMKSALIYQNTKIIDMNKDKKGLFSLYINKVLTKEKIEKQFDNLFLKAIKSKKDRYFFNGAFFNTKYMMEHGSLNDNDFINTLKQYKGNILMITGKSDLNMNYNNLYSLDGIKNVTIYTPEGINHILRKIDTEQNIFNMKNEYIRYSKKEIDKDVIKVIKEWLMKYE